MKIHSSSLTFSPIDFNRQQLDKRNKAQNHDANDELLVSKETLDKKSNKPVLPAYSPAEIKQTFNNTVLSFNGVKQENIINTKTLRALTAYHQEINEPLQDQRSSLIQGIDIYA
ncbi:MAG: hypothetical protein ACXWTK_04590 [Methylobacter sp.]